MFSPDGSRIASVSNDDGTLRIWDADTRAELLVIQGVGAMLGRCLDFSPDGRRVAALVRPADVGIFDVETGARLVQFLAYSGSAYSALGGCVLFTGRPTPLRRRVGEHVL